MTSEGETPLAAEPDAGFVTPLDSDGTDEPDEPQETGPTDVSFLDSVRGGMPEFAMDLRNEEITEMGGQACASLAAGNPRREVVEELGEYGLADSEARDLIKLARSNLCAQ
ncbi:DUF732 domain-containing protein [Actinoplanes sp. G11-F43]|uniref:DUF732 domain-containing protein n=1 Tax=Actinoplanes sp. G11-F43 TaxID=3424130 RepID=UPI003D346AC8